MASNGTKAKSKSGTEQSPAEHIKTLVGISEDIPQLLKSAGSAIAMLTPSQHSADILESSGEKGLEARKAAFLSHVREYYTTLSRVQSSLTKEVTALEDAGIISKEARAADSGGVTNDGLGNLDVAWLNSRSRDIGVDKEKELIQEAKSWLKKIQDNSDVKMEG